MPLPVDDALFETWGGVLGDVEKLFKGEEGVSVAELVQLGDHKWENPPPGFFDLGAFFTQPRDLTVSQAELRQLRRQDPGAISELLGGVLGPAYKAQMPATQLLKRLHRMRKEIQREEDTLERKLRYLIWLN